MVVTERPLSVSDARFSIAVSSRPAQRPELLAPEVHVLDDVEVVGEREVLVDDLDAEGRGVLRPWMLTGEPSKRTRRCRSGGCRRCT
jgi:hypothetical protein